MWLRSDRLTPPFNNPGANFSDSHDVRFLSAASQAAIFKTPPVFRQRQSGNFDFLPGALVYDG
jgi:hypothetical protein